MEEWSQVLRQLNNLSSIQFERSKGKQLPMCEVRTKQPRNKTYYLK